MRAPARRARPPRPPTAPRSGLADDAPEPAHEARHALGALLAPLHVLVGRRQRQDVEPDGVGAVALDQLVGADYVALRLRHLLAAELHPAVAEEAGERLAEAD